MRKGIHFVALLLSAWPAALPAQTPVVNLPKPDAEGWIKLFRGNNAADFYIANNGSSPPAQAQIAFPNGTFSARGDTIQVTGTPSGQIYFKQPFSHYRVRYQMRFPGTTGNCGMLIHVQQNDPTTNGFPRALESQGDPNQGMGQLWPIGDAWVTVRAHVVGSRMQYFPNDPETTYGGADWSHRVVAGKDGWANPSYATLSAATGWVTQEADVHGADSVADFVADTLRIRYRQPRISSGGTANNVSKYLASGLIAWQSEGRAVWYREIKIRLYPQDPLYPLLYTTGVSDARILPKIRTQPIMLFTGGRLLISRRAHASASVLGRVSILPSAQSKPEE